MLSLSLNLSLKVKKFRNYLSTGCDSFELTNFYFKAQFM